jgi:hypothetical protein
MDFTPGDIERFRRKLSQRKEGGNLEPTAFFPGLKGYRAWPSAVVVDFAMGRATEPVILIYQHGCLQDIKPTIEFTITSTDVEIDEHAPARFIRWIGSITGIERFENHGCFEVESKEPLTWDVSGANVIKNLMYAAELGKRLGIKRVAVIPEVGLSFSFPAVVGNGVRVKVLTGYRDARERQEAFDCLKAHLNSKKFLIMEHTTLFARLKTVVYSEKGDVAADTHPMVGAIATLAWNLQIDEIGQLFFQEDLT